MAWTQMSRLLRKRGFKRYFATVAAARATGTMFNVSGVLLVLERTHDLTLAGIVIAAASLPAAVTGPFLGGWLDVTASRRRLLVLDRVVTAGALVVLLALAGHAADWLLVAAALLYGATSPLSSGAFSAVLPEVAGVELLDAANAFEGASINAAFIVGPALAGLIVAAAGAGAAIELQILTGLALAVLIAVDETFELRPKHGAASPSGVLSAVRQGLGATWQIKPLRWNITIDIFYVRLRDRRRRRSPRGRLHVGGRGRRLDGRRLRSRRAPGSGPATLPDRRLLPGDGPDGRPLAAGRVRRRGARDDLHHRRARRPRPRGADLDSPATGPAAGARPGLHDGQQPAFGRHRRRRGRGRVDSARLRHRNDPVRLGGADRPGGGDRPAEPDRAELGARAQRKHWPSPRYVGTSSTIRSPSSR
jgi:hypothetical protein